MTFYQFIDEYEVYDIKKQCNIVYIDLIFYQFINW